MTNTCPHCGHQLSSGTLDGTAGPAARQPDPSVVSWFSSGDRWSGEASTAELYADYIRSAIDAPVSRQQFVTDLAYLGVEQVLDGETQVLLAD